MLTLISLLTGGAGGGIVGAITGIFKQAQERKERVEMARIDLERDQAEYANAEAQRKHDLEVLEKGGQLKLQELQTESEVEMEVAHQQTLSTAQIEEFKNLNTSSWVDNLRGSIRPGLAIWFSALFSVMIAWAFYKYSNQITDTEGKQILLGLFTTLSFTVTSIVTFYYVARRNSAPRI